MTPDETAAIQAAVILNLKSLGFAYAGSTTHIVAVPDDPEDAAAEIRDTYVKGPVTVTLAAAV